MTTCDRWQTARIVSALVIHFLLWSALLGSLVVAGPRFDRMFRDYNMKLPATTELVVSLSGAVTAVLPLAVVAVFLLLGVDFVVMYLAARHPNTRVLGRLWAIAMALVPLFGLVIVWFGLLLAWWHLYEGLRRGPVAAGETIALLVISCS